MNGTCQVPSLPTEGGDFADRLLGMLNEGSLGLMVSVGHRTGLFDAMANHGAGTSEAIAHASRLQERYVREWLHAMTTGGIVTHDPAEATFHLPEEHASFLTRAAAPNNVAVSFQFFSVLGSVETKIVDAFREGGGVPYEEFPRFHEVMAEESGQTVVSALFDQVLPLVPEVVEAMERGIDVLDVGCGSGFALCALAERFAASRFTGYDLCAEAIERANAWKERRGLQNARFEVRDVAALEEPARYDLITGFDVVHDQCDPARVLDVVHASLRPGGTFLMQDIRASSHVVNNLEHPVAPFLYTISTMHCMTVSLAQGGAGLGTCWGEELALSMLKTAGFEDVRVVQLEHDIQNNWYVMRKAV